jgi:hypothetical protein
VRHLLARLALAPALLGALAAAGPASAATVVDPPAGAFPYQQWVDEAKVPTPDVDIRVVETMCPSELAGFALACTAKGTYTIWLSPEGGDRQTFLHELGHNFDYYELGRWGSRQFRKIIDDDRPWRSGPGEIGLSPHEIFAEEYGICARKLTIKRAIIRLPPIRIGPAAHAAVCDLIERSYRPEPARPGDSGPVATAASADV